MNAESQKKILGYFIEEAKEHLETLEKGILELSSIAEDEEMINEMFRAAHSIKGGAAMLGYTSIQKIAHRLEDAFKVIKEEEAIEADQTLETLFFDGYDVLQDLVDRLSSPQGLEQEEGNQIMEAAMPKFVRLQEYLEQLQSGEVAPAAATTTEAPAAPATAPPANLDERVKTILRQMLTLFKQKSTSENRQQLEQLCGQLLQLASQESGWNNLIQASQKAIANPKHSYRLLAPVVIKEIKQASDLIVMGRGAEVSPSEGLNKLATASVPQILVPLEPKAAADLLLNSFNKQQLAQLVQFLQVEVNV